MWWWIGSRGAAREEESRVLPLISGAKIQGAGPPCHARTFVRSLAECEVGRPGRVPRRPRFVPARRRRARTRVGEGRTGTCLGAEDRAGTPAGSQFNTPGRAGFEGGSIPEFGTRFGEGCRLLWARRRPRDAFAPPELAPNSRRISGIERPCDTGTWFQDCAVNVKRRSDLQLAVIVVMFETGQHHEFGKCGLQLVLNIGVFIPCDERHRLRSKRGHGLFEAPP